MQSSLALVDLANMMLGVELEAKLGDEVDLGFKEVDMMFLVVGAVAGVVGIEGGVVSGVINLESSGVGASDWRPRHEKHYQEV